MANPIDQPEILARFPAADFEIKRFKSYSLESDYTVSTDGWELSVYEEDAKRIAKLRDLELQPIEILVDGAQQILGRVDITDIGGDGSAVTLQGRDYIADLVECHVDPALKFKEQMTLGDALKLAVVATVGDKRIRRANETAGFVHVVGLMAKTETAEATAKPAKPKKEAAPKAGKKAPPEPPAEDDSGDTW